MSSTTSMVDSNPSSQDELNNAENILALSHGSLSSLASPVSASVSGNNALACRYNDCQ